MVLVVVLAACTVKHAERVKAVSEGVTAGALLSMLGAVVVASVDPADKHEALAAGYVFVPISLLGAMVYIVADQTEPEEVVKVPAPAPPTNHNRDVAWQLTKQAAAASREGDCAEVQDLDPRIQQLDADFHSTVFLGDVAIRRCLATGQ